MKNFVLFLQLLFLISSCYGQNDNKINDSNLLGTWIPNCNNGNGYLKIIRTDSIELEVNSNQIYILSKGIESKGDTISVNIFLIEPSDLGRGGMSLNWNNFSTNIPIAALKYFNQNDIEFSWYGFFNKKTLKREWVDKIDWLMSNSRDYPICLKKCK